MENIPRLAANELDHGIQLGLCHQGLGHSANGAKFRCALLFGVEQTRVLQRNAHTACQRLQQAHIRVGKGVLTIKILQAEISVYLHPRSKGHIHQRLWDFRAFNDLQAILLHDFHAIFIDHQRLEGGNNVFVHRAEWQ